MPALEFLFGDDASILKETDFQLLLLAGMTPVLGTALVSPVLDSMIDPFGTSTAQISLMISVFTAPAIVMIPLVGTIADRYDRKPVIVSSLVLFGVGGTAIAFTTNYTVVLVLRLTQGIGFAGLGPIIITSIGDLYSKEREATGQGIRFMFSGLSGTIFPLISGMLVVFAWQYPFLLYAVTFPIAFVVALWFDEPTTTHETGNINHDDSISYTRALFHLLRQRRVFALVCARTLMTGVWIGFMTYNSLIVTRLLDGTPFQAGLLVAVLSLVMAIFASQVGRITALFERRFYPLIGANCSIGAGFILVLIAPGIPVAVIGVAISGMGIGIVGGLYRSIMTELPPEQFRAGLVSIAEMGGRVTNTVTPVVMGGIIAIATPVIGFGPAIQLAGGTVAVVVAGGSVVFLIVASISPPIPSG